MSKSLAAGGALLLLAAFISSADAGMPGGITGTAAMSRGEARIPMNTSTSSVRSFSADGPQLRGRGEHWKKSIDSDGGGAGDPPKKPPKDPQTGDSGGKPPRPPGGFYTDYRHPQGMEPPLACRGRPNGC